MAKGFSLLRSSANVSTAGLLDYVLVQLGLSHRSRFREASQLPF